MEPFVRCHVVYSELRETVGIPDWPRGEKESVKCCEQAGAQSNGKTERADRCDAKHWGPSERAQRVPHVLSEVVNGRQDPSRASGFPDMGYIAELSPTFDPGRFRRPAAVDEVAFRHGEVDANLVIEITPAMLASPPHEP